jgi:hypothetical protein
VNHSLSAGLFAFVCFASVACSTWFFSYHPRLFLRLFVPRDELRGAARAFLRNPKMPKAMRFMAGLQFVAAIVMAVLLALLSKW